MHQLLMEELTLYAIWTLNAIGLVLFVWFMWREHQHKDGD